MRIAPLIVWTSGLKNPTEIYNVLAAEAKITHPHPLVHSVNYVYTITVHSLLRFNPLKNDQNITKQQVAFKCAFLNSTQKLGSAKDNKSGESIQDWLILSEKMYLTFLESAKSNPEQNNDEITLKSLNDFTDMIGWVKHSFVLAFYFLLRS